MRLFKEGFKYTDIAILVLAVLLAVPDVKFFSVKPIELLGLISFVYSVRQLTKLELHLFGFFTFFLCVTLVHNSWMPFVEQAHQFPRKPYVISIARYFEYISCIGIISYVRRFILSKKSIDFFVGRLIFYSVVFNMGVLLFYLLEYFKISGNYVTYLAGSGIIRLKGFFFEGGPLGMYNAFLLILTFEFVDKKLKYYYAFLFALVIGLSLSKAGTVAVIVYLCFLFLRKLHLANLKLIYKTIICIVVIVPSVFVMHKLFSVYTDSLFDYQSLLQLVKHNPHHFWINGGRVPGFYIIKEIIINHPVLGIGIGNYQLLRDAEIFRAGFPTTSMWDYHGYGGLIDIIVQNGLLGLIIFFTILLLNIRINRLIYIGIFLIPFCFGTTLHFCYPWIMLAIIEKSLK